MSEPQEPYVWDRVDDTEDPDEMVTVQQDLERWPVVRAYRERMRELVGGGRALDVGAGPGGETTYVGVDNSMAMARRAYDRGRVAVVADAGRLPFAAGSFDAVRADRVLQHVPDPDTALAEATRVVRPGGRLVFADPDQSTLTIEAEPVGVRSGAALVAEVVAFRRRSIRNPDLAGRLAGRLTALGLVDVVSDAYRLVLTDPALAFGVTGWGELIEAAGRITAAERAAWEAALHGPFRYEVSYVVTAARRAG
ncbi:methyltransferase domain-containing protein [Actinocatenispora rupis]|uniref:methyltransferase domain-containing protein n=1 Tax=Actinocatenispora rupis TaxID=519421 RepID=UPI001EF1CD71|nr:methyltransferase domain-containing protein [Actinocatenispora rupis]